jgi:hypothetical protein
MDILTEAFKGLFPEEEPTLEMKLKYSGKFSSYNGNVRYTKAAMEFHLSREWKEVDRDIKIGLIQSLMTKVFKRRRDVPKTTSNIDMYNIFIKKIHIAAPRIDNEPELFESFNRINKKYFDSLIEPANLKWGGAAKNKFGSYIYGRDMITINPILKGKSELIDYVMYHEMLHKKLKFNHSNGRSYHHTKEFRAKEKSYPDAENLENQLKMVSRSQNNPIRRLNKRLKLFNWF